MIIQPHWRLFNESNKLRRSIIVLHKYLPIFTKHHPQLSTSASSEAGMKVVHQWQWHISQYFWWLYGAIKWCLCSSKLILNINKISQVESSPSPLHIPIFVSLPLPLHSGFLHASNSFSQNPMQSKSNWIFLQLTFPHKLCPQATNWEPETEILQYFSITGTSNITTFSQPVLLLTS